MTDPSDERRRACWTAAQATGMGMAAARAGDMHLCPMVTGIVPHVGGPILPPGCPIVIIGGMPAARLGDMTAHGGAIVLGAPPCSSAEP